MSDKNIMNPETKPKKKFKLPDFKNKSVFKHGTYAVIITAVVLVGIIAFNILISALSTRFMLEYDMTVDKVNTISEDNINFIKEIDTPVKVRVCALESQYISYMGSIIASEYEAKGVYFNTSEDYSKYFSQTINLIEKYGDYNRKIDVEFLDTQDASFAEIVSNYSKEDLGYGDIIVSCEINGNERYKIVSYEDIYDLQEDDSMAMYYGYTSASLAGNNIETALTSAIAYVTNAKDTKVAFLTGHTKDDFSEAYQKLLKTNNYIVDVIDSKVVTSIPQKYDAIFIIGPTNDFNEDELSVIADYLDNGEKYGKGLVFVADASAPYLPNIYGFLEEWGILIEEGVLFETNSDYHSTGMPTVMYTGPMGNDEILNGMGLCMSSMNIPMTHAFEEESDKAVSYLYATSSSVVAAPKGTSDNWTGAKDYEKSAFGSIMQSQRTAYDKNSNLLKNNVIVMGSTDYVYSDFVEDSRMSNKNISFAVAERAVGAEDTGISFVTKTITEESFAASVTESSAQTIKWIFMIVLPVACLVAGIVVYIRRRNA